VLRRLGADFGLETAAVDSVMDDGHVDPFGVYHHQLPHARLGGLRGELVLHVASGVCGGCDAGAGGAPERSGWPQ
jgi:hypothetical protein